MKLSMHSLFPWFTFSFLYTNVFYTENKMHAHRLPIDSKHWAPCHMTNTRDQSVIQEAASMAARLPRHVSHPHIHALSMGVIKK